MFKIIRSFTNVSESSNRACVVSSCVQFDTHHNSSNETECMTFHDLVISSSYTKNGLKHELIEHTSSIYTVNPLVIKKETVSK